MGQQMTDSLPAGFESRTIGSAVVVAQAAIVDELADAVRTAGTLYDWASEQPQRQALRGRAPVYVARLVSGTRVAVRHAWHGGMLAPFTGDRYLRPSRAAVELSKSLLLQECGIPTAPVLGYALYRVFPGVVRVDVVSRYIERASDFDAVMSGLAADVDLTGAVNAIQKLLAQLQQQHLVHRDLNVKNILVSPGAADTAAASAYTGAGRRTTPLAWVIDVDTMKHRPELSDQAVNDANVARLTRSIRKWQRQRADEMAESGNIAGYVIREITGTGLRSDTPRFCIVMMSAVGDAVHVMPIVNAIKAWNPHSHITWVLQPGPASLVRGHPHIDEIIIFDRSKGWRAFAHVRGELRKRKFDVVLALQVYLKAGIITSFARAPIKLGFDRARARDMNWLFTTRRISARTGQHVQDQYFEFLEDLGIPYGEPEWGLGPWNQSECHWQRAFVQQFERPVAAIVVATSKEQKDWLPERWSEVCARLYYDYGLQPVLTGGTSERERRAEAIIRSRTPIVHSELGSGLRRLAAILDASALALSPDTGPLHLSVALKTPVISLIGYTNPKRVGPYNTSRDLMIDAYGDPGEDYPLNMTYRHNRMPRITVHDVIERVAVWERDYREKRFALLRERGLLIE